MVFTGIVSSPRANISLQKALELANVYLENAINATDSELTLVFCHDTEVTLSQAKRIVNNNSDDKTLREGIATAYVNLGQLLHTRGHFREAQASYKKAERMGGNVPQPGQPANSRSIGVRQSIRNALLSSSGATTTSLPITPLLNNNFFTANLPPPTIAFKPPQPDMRLDHTPQLAYCLDLLQSPQEPTNTLDQTTLNWLDTTKSDPYENERLRTLATDVLRAFKRDELKDARAVTEVVYLAPVLDTDDFRYLVREFYNGIDQSGLLDIHQLEGMARLMQGTDPGRLDADDLVKILDLLSSRLRGTHNQSPQHLYSLTLAVSHVLDAMADASVKDLDRKKLHEPLSFYLEELKRTKDSFLVYQAAYAYQALLYVPDNETLWQEAFRRTGKVIKGVTTLVSAVEKMDLNKFIDGLNDVQKGVAGAAKVLKAVKQGYDGAMSLTESGQGFLESLKEGFSFTQKCSWYPALRGAEKLLQDGKLADFRILVCEAPCRQDPAFQWGICQRLGEMAINSMWDTDTRLGAVAFLGEMYQNDAIWGNLANSKRWILNILMQISSSPGIENDVHPIIQELAKNGDAKKQELYKASLARGVEFCPLNIFPAPFATPSLLDRVQNRTDVEGNLRNLKRSRSNARDTSVYIQPQAKPSIQAPDDTRFPLMEKVMEFLNSDQKVFLLLGDSGAGKSTFNRELESILWQTYKAREGVIPLHINLPAIDKPEHDMIAKQLRRAEFTEPEIRELKGYRKFVLICDGYDESQQTHNLYMSNRLNQKGEWSAKMIISCRSEYLGIDYRDRFQPGDRNHRPEPGQFQEAVMTPFSVNQIEDYIDQYVFVHQPMWEAIEYKRALDLIPSLKDLVSNPFLMTLSLEVLPRMVDPGQNLSATRVDRVSLYDQFIVHWLERGKKRLGEKELSYQAKAALESLVDEGFTENGIEFMKKLAVAIYKEQGGQPIVKYSRFKDNEPWKSEFFSREDENQLLREACPLTRSGNQHRFVHRSLLEYGLALAVFDPQEWKEKIAALQLSDRRGSVGSEFSFHIDGTAEVSETPSEPIDLMELIKQEPDPSSPLVWRYFLNEPSIIQFLSERSQQEPVFKQQLLSYIEHSKRDKRWRRAAANAMTILVRAGEQFNGADLRGIRIPGADLSYGMFDSAQLQKADLRQVNLRGVWLRQADLSDAKMTGTQFGEFPVLEENNTVCSCAYSPDGKTFVVGLGAGNEIKVYSTSSREVIRTLTGHEFVLYTTSVAYSPHGDRIASGCQNNKIKLWDAETGDLLHDLSGHKGYVNDVAFSPQGDALASTSDDETVRIWDVDTGECRLTLTGHERKITSVTFSPNGDIVASGSYDGTTRLWDVATGVCSRVLRTGLRGMGIWINSVAFSPRGDVIAAASNADIVLWDLEAGTSRLSFTGHRDNITSVSFSPQGDLIASASVDMTVRLWDAETGICRHIFTGHTSDVTEIAFSPDGNHVISGSEDWTIRLWDVKAAASDHTSVGPGDNVSNILFSPHGDQIATCNLNGTIHLWDVESGSSRRILSGLDANLDDIVYSSQGDLIASHSPHGTFRVWNTRTGDLLQTFSGHSGFVEAITFSPEGDQVASGGAGLEYSIRLWTVSTGDCLRTLTGHTDDVERIVYSPQGHQLASGSRDNTVRIWDPDTGDCLQTLTGHTGSVAHVVYSPDGHQVASASWDNTVKLWDAQSWTCLHTFTDFQHSSPGPMFSPEGHQLTFAPLSIVKLEIQVRDTDTGDCTQIMRGHTFEITSVAYSPKGDLIASSSGDKTVRLWDVASGQCRLVIPDFTDHVKKVVWSPSSESGHFATICRAGSVRLWRFIDDKDSCRAHLCWNSGRHGLIATDASLQDVNGLSLVNKQLLRQRGAFGEPSLHEASKQIISTASITSALGQLSSSELVDRTSSVDPSIEQSKQDVAQEETRSTPEI